MALVISLAIRKELKAMPERERQQLLIRLEAIADDPLARHAGVAALRGAPAGRLRVRQGDWRAVFRIEGGDVVVDRVAHRSEVYDR